MPGGTVAVASGHAGFDLNENLKRDLQAAGREALGLGGRLIDPRTAREAPKLVLDTKLRAAAIPDRSPSFSKVMLNE
jgi:hypothetical protein